MSLITGLLLLQSGCMTPAHSLDKEVVNRELSTVKDQKEIRNFFGAPKVVSQANDGRILDFYFFELPRSHSTATGRMVVEERALSIIYHPDGRMDEFKYYVGETGVLEGVDQQWSMGRWFNPKMLAQIKPGVSTRDDLIQIFGPATAEVLSLTAHLEMHWWFLNGSKADFSRGYELVVALDDNLVVRGSRVQNLGSNE